MVSHPETGSDPPIGSNLESGRDRYGLVLACLWLAFRPLCRLFCGHVYATVGLVDQGCHCLSFG